jgi:hypothetical protein
VTDETNEMPGRGEGPETPPRPDAEARTADLPPLPPRARQPAVTGAPERDSASAAAAAAVAADAATPAVTARRNRTERAERLARERIIMRNRILAVGGAVVVVILLAAGAVFAFGHGPGSGQGLASSGSGSSTTPGKTSKASRITQGDATVSTPVFARIGDMLIHLPVAPEALTAVMFHQSSRNNAYDMTSLVPDANRAKIFKLVKGGAKLPIASSAVGTQSVDSRDGEKILDSYWKGTVVRVYRMNRVGKPASAVDAGAKAGTVVVAAVSGTVTRIRPYKLYGKYADFEIHIRPDAMPQADLVVIHVSDILVRPGDWVIGGVTPIAHVRLLSNRMKHQLGEYTGEQGDHTHIQFNKHPSSAVDDTPSS